MHLAIQKISRFAALALVLSALFLAGGCKLFGDRHRDSNEQAPTQEAGEQRVPDVALSAFQSGGTKPTIVSFVPTGSQIHTSTNVEVTFDGDLDASAANALSVIVAGAAVPGNGRYVASEKKIVFDPANSLPANTEIFVVLDNAMSADRQFLTDAHSWQFTTGS